MVLALALFLGLTALAGCGVRELARGEIQAPRVTFQGLTVYPPSADGWPLAANLVLENPNSQPLNLLGYNYQLWLEGRSVAQGVSQEAVSLPPLGQTTARFPITVKTNALLGLLPAILQHPQQKLRYQIAGSFRLASVLGGIIPVPFRFQGEASPKEGEALLKPYLR